MTKRNRKQAAVAIETIELTGEELQAIENAEAVEAIESTEAEAEVQASSGIEEAPAVSFMETLEAFAADSDAIDAGRMKLAAAFDERAAFERAKSATNENIQKTIAKGRAKLIEGRSVAVLLAACATPDFVMRSTSEGSAYNVYAIDKVADLVKALSSGVIGIAINRTIIKSLFQFAAANEPFTGDMARAAVSDKIRVQGAIAKLLVRHDVAPSTAPTQASSTMQALSTLGVVRNVGTTRAPVYQLTEEPIVERMKEIAQAA